MNLVEILKTTEFTKEEIIYLVDSYKKNVEESIKMEEKTERAFKAVEALRTFNEAFGNDEFSIEISGGEDALEKAKAKFEEFKKETILIKQIYEKLKPLTELTD